MVQAHWSTTDFSFFFCNSYPIEARSTDFNFFSSATVIPLKHIQLILAFFLLQQLSHWSTADFSFFFSATALTAVYQPVLHLYKACLNPDIWFKSPYLKINITSLWLWMWILPNNWNRWCKNMNFFIRKLINM